MAASLQRERKRCSCWLPIALDLVFEAYRSKLLVIIALATILGQIAALVLGIVSLPSCMFYGVPALILGGLSLVFGSMALISWPAYARLVRAQVLSIRNRPYVTAARALGLTNRIILMRYVLPNATGPLVVAVSAGLGSAMVLESAFSFLGIGVNPPTPSWGNMISDGLRVWTNYPHLLLAPAAVLAVVTVAFNFLGDGLNDALNPKGQK